MSEIIKVNQTAFAAIQDETLKSLTEMLVSDIVNMHYYMARASVVLVAIDESGCYANDGYESIHDYTRSVLGIKQAQSYAILKVGRTLINTETFESLLPHEKGDDYSMSQLQALLPLNSVDVAQDMALSGEISPDMTVKEIKSVVAQYRRNLKGGDDEPTETEIIEPDSMQEPDEPESADNPVISSEVEYVIFIGHKSDGTPWARVNDAFVPYEQAYEIVANGMKAI